MNSSTQKFIKRSGTKRMMKNLFKRSLMNLYKNSLLISMELSWRLVFCYRLETLSLLLTRAESQSKEHVTFYTNELE
jgi:hypothetical protein